MAGRLAAQYTSAPVEHELHRLLPFYAAERASRQPLALAVVLRTAGSTYRKSGAWMLIAADGRYAGLLSGGCLEGDLRDHAVQVITDGKAALVRYDMRGPDDELWGIGSGCEGAMDILLTRIGGPEGWQPLEAMQQAVERHEACAFGIVTADAPGGPPRGTVVMPPPGAARSPAFEAAGARDTLFVVEVFPPLHVLLLGAGPDALPVAELVHFLGFRLTVADHRAEYTDRARFPAGTRVIECRPEALADHCDLARVDAAVVMSHHLESDRAYLAALAPTSIAYIGLLGPQPRRERLLRDLGAAADALRGRLRAPIGLEIGARSPTSIALSIVAQIQAEVAARPAQPAARAEPRPRRGRGA